MKNQLISLACSLVVVACMPSLSYGTVTTLDPHNPTDCAKFNDNNTVIVVYKSGYNVGSILENISNNPKYHTVSFYQIVDKNDRDICGRAGFHNAMIFTRNNHGKEKIFDGNTLKRLDTQNTTHRIVSNSAQSSTRLFSLDGWFGNAAEAEDTLTVGTILGWLWLSN